MNEGIVAGGGPRLRLERQSIPDGRIAGNQVAAFAAQEPRSRLPSIAGLAARNGQYVAYGLVQALFENLARRARSIGSSSRESNGSTFAGKRRSRHR